MQNFNKANNIAKGGILSALSILLIYLTTVIPVNKLFLLGLSSCIIPLCILLTDIKNTLIVYLSVSILCLFIVPSKGIAISYILLFGLYGFIKFYIEKLRKTPIEIILKLLFLNTVIFVIYTLYTTLFTNMISINLPVYAVIILLQIIFIIYDYSLTIFITYAHKNLINRLK